MRLFVFRSLFVLLPLGAVVLAGVFGIERVRAEDATVTAVVGDEPAAVIQWVLPQGRVGAAETNDDTTFYLTVRTQSNVDDVVLFTQPALATTNVDGTYSTLIPFSGITPGIYDIGIKGSQHLTRVLNDVAIVSGSNTLNFTQADNSAPKGTQVLLAGDVNGAGTDPSNLGDDVVNAVDVSTILANIDDVDLTGNTERTNLNQDPVVNSVDLSLLIGNLDVQGDN